MRRWSGFTLIELLIVIAIISILSVVGIVLFTGVQKGARDAKRRADVDAIVKVYEMKFSAGEYYEVTPNDFAENKIPTPPEGGSYGGLISGMASGFQVCAALEDNPNRVCSASSSTCFCVRSSQGVYVASAPSPSPSSSPTSSSSPAPGSSVYGALINSMDHTTTRAKVAQNMQAAKDSGATWVRTAFWWYSVKYSSPSDPYDWHFFDYLTEEASSRGLKLIAILIGTPPWAKASGDPTAWDAFAVPRMDYWQDFVTSTVYRYKNTVHDWEIGNEPDNPDYWHGTPHDYALTLAGAQIMIKLVDPTANVWLGGLAQGPNSVPNFLQQILADSQYPAGNYYDIHNFHTNFLTMADIQGHIGGNKYWLDQYSLTKPFAITENSYTSNTAFQPLAGYQDGEAGQARYVSNSYSTILSTLQTLNIPAYAVVWASLIDEPVANSSEYSESGLLNRVTYTPKAAYTTYQQITGY